MDTVHIFACARRFIDAQHFADFVEADYSDDGDIIDSEFMREIGLHDGYEPMTIEKCLLSDTANLRSALSGCSYLDQYINDLPIDLSADAIVCVFSPNRPKSPSLSSMTYVGAFSYTP
ncbi:hypothetical protein LF1_52470 [Rubripirellula obstinata]|uniref:Uncharacterized protein n=1 Tax=Rubripirellula obstinata TaxID=406547 RepID=A0A5B1C8E6_9BACT|nr:immunity 22 family protein [Rubripirellula obstinata]KAA1257256.1 hypothetical protein LF1_54050 [Rubripirellula obstinata]KAA1257398.1 hypothetical protein LF1_52470 [Rubripirellula obstinata]